MRNEKNNLSTPLILRMKLKMKREKSIKHVRKETGWPRKKALAEMKNAKEKGLPFYRYVSAQCWKLNQVELDSFISELLRLEKNKQKLISDICGITGWEANRAAEEISKAKCFGITNKQYSSKSLYLLSDTELREYAEELKKRKENNNADNKFYIEAVCTKTGWSSERAQDEMNKMKEKGVSYLKYVQKELWNKNIDADAVIKFIKEDKKRISSNKQVYIDRICEATGWNTAKAELEVLKAKNICGSSYEDYLVYRFYEKSAEEQKQYVTLGMFNKMMIKYNEHTASAQNFDDKAQFNRNFKDLIKHSWFINENLSYSEFLNNIRNLDKIIIKPLAATQGKGIEVLPCNVSNENNKELYEHIMELDKSIVEEYIVQHEDMMQFCSSSVNTVRVMTLNYNGECKFLYSVFRMGKDGVVDNFHAGGVAASVDLDTGIVCSNAADLNGNVFTNSPSTGAKIKGFKIPHWDVIREICIKATGRIKGTDLVGWDFAVTPEGADLIEGNPGASYIVAQIPNVEDNIGLANVMALPYL